MRISRTRGDPGGSMVPFSGCVRVSFPCGLVRAVWENKLCSANEVGWFRSVKLSPAWMTCWRRRSATTQPQERHSFTVADQVNQLVRASEADPERRFIARLMAHCRAPTVRSRSIMNAVGGWVAQRNGCTLSFLRQRPFRRDWRTHYVRVRMVDRSCSELPAFDLSLVLALAAALPGPRPRHRRRSC